ncbi:MAG: glycosyltransferase family A protein [Armatimonas sp.]
MKISVVIPAYNAEKTISATLSSILGQTHAPDEIIVVDDGSKDNTCAVVSQNFPQVKLLRRENGGPAAARNQGIRDATGDWIALLDADDTWLPNRLEKQVPLTADPEVAIVHCYVKPDSQAPEVIDFAALWKKNCIANSTVLIRRAALEQVGWLNEARELISVEDYNLWLRITHAGWKVATCREVLVNYTPTPGSLSMQTERFARAEFANLDAIQKALNLSDDVVATKRAAIAEQYGRDLLYDRNIKAAREMLGRALKTHPTPKRYIFWGATFLPVWLLDLRSRRSSVA